MKNSPNSRTRSKRRRSLGSRLGTAGLLIFVVSIGALFVLAKPIPKLLSFIHANKPAVKATTQSPPVTSVQTATVEVAPPATLPVGSIFLANPKLPLTVIRTIQHGVALVLVEGGTLGARRSPVRQGVEDFVKDAGATAGLNGTFFANASLEGTDNLLIGPSLCDNETTETMSPFDSKPQLQGRPLVVVSQNSTSIVPYDIATLSLPGAIQTLMPNITDAFLGGVWLVSGGQAMTLQQIAAFNVHDAEDPRRRAFFALMPDGRPVLGATDCSTTSRHLAEALASAGIREAVLLDSGFSTSLVFQNTLLVSGHSTKDIPSRPVPQALVLYGQPDPSVAILTPATPSTS